jgi:hypothetical protein
LLEPITGVGVHKVVKAENGGALVGTHDKEGLAEARSYIAAMQRVGQPVQLLVVAGTHDWGVWHAGLPLCVNFLLN